MKRFLSVILTFAMLIMTLASCGGSRKKVDISDAKSLSEINGTGAIIAAQSGTFHLQAMNEQMNGVTKKEYKDFSALLMALKSGSIDGYIAEEPTAFVVTLKDDTIAYLPFVNNKTGFSVTGDDTGIAVAFKKDSPLVEKVNTILDAVSEDTKLELMNQIFEVCKDTEKELNLTYVLTSDNTDTSNGTLKISMECAYEPFNWTQTTAANGAVPKKGAQHGYPPTGSLCVYRKIPEFFPCGSKALSFAADRQFAYQQSGKRTSYAAFEANDQEFVGHARRADPLQLRS